MVEQGEIWWADLGAPQGSMPGFRRPVIVVQDDSVTRSRIRTVVCMPLTTNSKWSIVPTNLLLPKASTGLPHDSVAQPTQILTVDQRLLVECIGKISRRQLDQLFARLDLVLGRG